MVNYATDSGVRIECSYTCKRMEVAASYLWVLRTFSQKELGAIELHDRESREDIERELLDVKFNITSDDSCDSTGKSNFYLDIVGMSDMLQHAAVSCGVRVDMNSPKVYSRTDSYIIISDTGK